MSLAFLATVTLVFVLEVAWIVHAPALSGKVKGAILVRFDHGPHRRATMASCKVLQRHGFNRHRHLGVHRRA